MESAYKAIDGTWVLPSCVPVPGMGVIPVNAYLIKARVPVLVDTDDLIDSTDIAVMLGLADHRVVSVLRRRHHDFPAPVIAKTSGRCSLWRRADVAAWAESTGRTYGG